jgi:hypothetical protein
LVGSNGELPDPSREKSRTDNSTPAGGSTASAMFRDCVVVVGRAVVSEKKKTSRERGVGKISHRL